MGKRGGERNDGEKGENKRRGKKGRIEEKVEGGK